MRAHAGVARLVEDGEHRFRRPLARDRLARVLGELLLVVVVLHAVPKPGDDAHPQDLTVVIDAAAQGLGADGSHLAWDEVHPFLKPPLEL
jgi:hypothetical protein